jgi:hypothetical protein
MRWSIPLCLVLICILASACPRKGDEMTDKSSIASEATGTPTAREFIATESWLTRISGSDRAKSALELNQTGNELYILKDCERAAFFFGAATEKDSSLIVAHYNLARMLSLLYGQKKTDDLNLIIRHLHLTWRLDPAYRIKMKTDAALNPIRSAPAYRQWVAQLDKQEFAILSARFPTAYFQYYSPFMYRSEAAVFMHVEMDGKTGFIPLDSVTMLKMPEFDSALVCNIYFVEEAALQELRTKSKNDEREIEPFGELRIDGMSHSVHIMFYNTLGKKVVAEIEEKDWRVSIGLGSGLNEIRPVEGWDAFQCVVSEFSSGWYRDLKVYALDYAGRITSSEPLRLASEDLRGGQAKLPDVDYKNARREGDAIVIDKLENGRFLETLAIIDLKE